MTAITSFRDPGGFVSVSKERVVRTVLAAGLGNLNACLNSPAARLFVEKGALIACNSVTFDVPAARGGAVLEHPRIPFASYPQEWPAAMLHRAGELTLELCAALLEEGLGLKDATPSNILFRGPHPVFVDVLSFETRAPLDPIWLAGAQFARTFLIPLLLNRRTGSPVHEIFLWHRDGIGPAEAVNRLPRLRRWLPPDLGLVTLPAKAARLESDKLYQPRHTSDAGEARFILSHRFSGLKKLLHQLAPRPTASTWSTYEKACPSYSAEQHAAKHQFVERTLRTVGPCRVLDVGCNTGEFSLMAAAAGAAVVAIDSDPETVGALWRTARDASADVLPLVVDFARPTPAAGWRSQEQPGFLERAEGFFDCALLLAVTHHLMVTDQIPLAQIFEATAALTTRWAIVEYVGPRDPMFHRLARGRDALYQSYGQPFFEECARRYFDIESFIDLPSSDRAIYLLRRKA